jgi:diaminopimelate epimerase
VSPLDGAVFLKLSGGGNDFVVLADLEGELGPLSADQVRRLCARRLSLGADGVIVLRPSAGATARFELRNRDGSRAAFSGNGGRCAARALAELGLAAEGRVSLETEGGPVEARLRLDPAGRTEVGLDVTPPRDLRPEVVLPPPSPSPTGTFAVVGVPYLAVPVEDVDAVDIETVAPPLRRLRCFRQGANVAFYEPASRPVRLRTWERGVEGETLSSGTGCAIVALALALGEDRLERSGERELVFAPRSGIAATVRLEVRDGAVARIVLTGDARLIARGRLGPDALVGFE